MSRTGKIITLWTIVLLFVGSGVLATLLQSTHYSSNLVELSLDEGTNVTIQSQNSVEIESSSNGYFQFNYGRKPVLYGTPEEPRLGDIQEYYHLLEEASPGTYSLIHGKNVSVRIQSSIESFAVDVAPTDARSTRVIVSCILVLTLIWGIVSVGIAVATYKKTTE